MSTTRQQVNKLKRLRLPQYNFFNLLLFIFLGYLLTGIVIGHNSIVYYTDMQAKVAKQQQELINLQERTKVLERQVDFLKNKTLANYEFLFKRNLNYIRNDEVFFRIISDRETIKFKDGK